MFSLIPIYLLYPSNESNPIKKPDNLPLLNVMNIDSHWFGLSLQFEE